MNPACYVIGGGLIGLMCARELQASGQSVVLLEGQLVGRGSSWAGGGILSPLYPWRYPEPVNSLAIWGQNRYESLASDLAHATGIDPEWSRSGLIILEDGEIDLSLSWAEMSGKLVEVLEKDQISALLGRPVSIPRGMWLADVAQIRNPRLVSALLDDLRRKGVEIREKSPITGIIAKNGKLLGLRTADAILEVDRCVVAAGAWTAKILNGLEPSLPIKPVRGQMLLYYAPELKLSPILLKDYHYLIARRDGHVLVGSTFEDSGFDDGTTARGREDLEAAARDLCPDLARMPVIAHWAGLRPGSPDGVPYIGQHPQIEGLFICAGHFRNGIVMGPASARLLTDVMLDRPPCVDPAPYSLERL